MKLQQVFEKAVEGGWNPGSKFVRIDEGDAVFLEDGLQEWRCDIGGVFMSPLFWKAYGEAMGWDGIDWNWKYYWHRFIDHLADGGTIESFFEQF